MRLQWNLKSHEPPNHTRRNKYAFHWTIATMKIKNSSILPQWKALMDFRMKTSTQIRLRRTKSTCPIENKRSQNQKSITPALKRELFKKHRLKAKTCGQGLQSDERLSLATANRSKEERVRRENTIKGHQKQSRSKESEKEMKIETSWKASSSRRRRRSGEMPPCPSLWSTEKDRVFRH